MLTYKIFDVEIVRDISVSRLSWPKPGEASHDSGLGCNRQYDDLRRFPWSEARRVYEMETRVMARIEASDNPEQELEQIEDALCEDGVDHIYGLDIGVASTVVALSAARCLPFTSCNAGAFGGAHLELHPLVAFFARRQAVAPLLDCAEEADTGLSNSNHGALVVYANNIRKMRAFAQELIRRSSTFRALRLSSSSSESKKRATLEQYQLKLL